MTFELIEVGDVVFDKGFLKEPKIWYRWLDINEEIGEMYKNGDEHLKGLIEQLIKENGGT